MIVNILSLEMGPNTRVTGFVFGQSMASWFLPLTTKDALLGGKPTTHSVLSYGRSSEMTFINVKHTYKIRIK